MDLLKGIHFDPLPFLFCSIDRASLYHFTREKSIRVAKRAGLLCFIYAMFGSSALFNRQSVTSYYSDIMDIRHSQLDALFFRCYDDTLVTIIHYATIWTVFLSIKWISEFSVVTRFWDIWDPISTTVFVPGSFAIIWIVLDAVPLREYKMRTREKSKLAHGSIVLKSVAIFPLVSWLAQVVMISLLWLGVLGAFILIVKDQYRGRIAWHMPESRQWSAGHLIPRLIYVANRDPMIIFDFVILLAVTISFINFVSLKNQLSRLLSWLLNFMTRSDGGTLRSSYRYSRLDNGEIRLLKVYISASKSILNCTLIHCSIKDAPRYECVSYCWGNPNDTQEILINGCRFRISATAHEVLSARARTWRGRYIWIDSVCINQADNAEKTRQVRLMREIFESARRVIVWLGKFEGAESATELLAELRLLSDKRLRNVEKIYKHYIETKRSANWNSLVGLLKLPWFHRIWVIQEVAVAQRLVVLVGGKKFDWETFLAVIKIFADPSMALLLQVPADFTDEHSAVDGVRHALLMSGFRRMFQRCEALSLASCLQSTTGFKSTEPQDRLYALLGMASDTSTLDPDYSKSAEEVFCDTARWFVDLHEYLDICAFAGMGYDRNMTSLPSWVPDWSKTRNGLVSFSGRQPGSRKTSYHAADKAKPRIWTVGARSLCINAIFVDRIAKISETYQHHYPGADARNPWIAEFKLRVSWHDNAVRLTGQKAKDRYGQLEEAFWRSLIGDRASNSRPAPLEYCEYYRRWKTLAHKIINTPLSDHLDEENQEVLSELYWTETRQAQANCMALAKWTSAMAQSCHGRRFCVTETGYIGLVPPHCQVRDTICVFLGAQVPYVVRRPVERECNGRDEWELLGESYVHRMMDGEIINCRGAKPIVLI